MSNFQTHLDVDFPRAVIFDRFMLFLKPELTAFRQSSLTKYVLTGTFLPFNKNIYGNIYRVLEKAFDKIIEMIIFIKTNNIADV